MANGLPTGVVTFLMTDVEGSTSVWRDAPEAAALMARQAELIGRAVAKHGGVRPADQGEGDSLLAAFARPRDAIAAACDAQRALHGEPWPEGAAVRVRMSVHTGEAELRDDANYGGLAVIRCARLRALASGGQVLVSSTAAALAGERLPGAVTLALLDTVPIAGFDGPERVFQLRHPELPSGFAALRRPLAGVPAAATPLLGRERERGELAELLDTQRLVTVTGAGGSGKTRLALAVAEDLGARLEGGAVWVELARLSDGEQVAGAVLAACGVREAPGVDALDLLVSHLASAEHRGAVRSRERLLVLDNCEHLLAACAALVDRLVRGAGAVRVLATSREPLGVPGETSWRIPSLAVPAEGEADPERLSPLGAVQLFVARAQAARTGFALDAATAPLVARICRRLDGIPLALELAAARVRTLSLERLADGLDDRFRLLTGGSRTAVERQRTLLASVEWSHDLLDEEERTLFRRLSVFAAPFSVEAAEAVAADDDLDAFAVLDQLARLVDKSLVVHEGDRYRMLETIRQYAQVRTDQAGELALLRDRHLAWFRRRAEGWRLDREIATTRDLAEVAIEESDLIAAAEWSAAHGRRLPPAILHALGQAWGGSDRFREVRTVGRRLLDALEPESPAWLEGLAPLANLLVLAGDLAWQESAQRLLAAEGGALDPVACAFVEGPLWLMPAYFGSSEALARLEAIAQRGRELGNVWLEASVRADIAMLRAQTGDPAGARSHLEWLDRNVGRDTWMLSLVRASHALCATYDGDFRAAHRYAEAAEGDESLATLVIAGVLYFWETDASALGRTLVHIERLVASTAFAGAAQLVRGQLALLAGDLDAAERAFELVQPGMLGSSHFWHMLLRAEVALSRGNVDGAAERVEQLVEGTTGTELHYNRACGRILAAYLARRKGERLEAESLVHAALGDAMAHGMSLALTDALELLAVLAGDRSDVESAGRLLGAATAFRAKSGYRWAALHHREAREALRATLPEAALTEGAALSLAEAAAYAARGRGERGRPDFGWESLTPSEQRVVEGVAEGLANAAIAKRLFVSLATVKTHLVHVYAKLGVATRAELAAAATKRRMKEG